MGIMKSIYRSVSSTIVGIGLAAMVASCSGVEEEPGCNFDSECNSGEVCMDEIEECRPPGWECDFDDDCDLEEICAAQRCEERNFSNNPSISDPLSEASFNGARMVQYRPNSDGVVSFMEGNEQVNIIFTGQDGRMIRNPTDGLLTYFDHPDFKCFLFDHDLYVPRFECADHNSDHEMYDLILRTFDTVQEIVHQRYGNDRSEEALERFDQWAEGWQQTDCWNREDIEDARFVGIATAKFASKHVSLGISDDSIDEFNQYLDDQEVLTENTIANVHVVIPQNQGMRFSTSAIFVPQFRESATGCDSEPECDDECNTGDTRCSGDNVESCLTNHDADICSEWGYEENCEDLWECSSGSCVPERVDCYDDCSAIGWHCADETTVYECVRRSDGCTDLVEHDSCPPNQHCERNACTPDDDTCEDECSTDFCSGNDLYGCVTGSDGCLDSVYSTTCDDGCSGGECDDNPSCFDTCSEVNIYCSSSGNVHECYRNTSGCLEVRTIEICASGCEDADCIVGGDCSDPLPDGWIHCSCPEAHYAECHIDDDRRCP